MERVDGTEGRFLEPDRLHIPDVSMHARFSPDGKWVVFRSDRAGFNDEWTTGWFPQPYGELHAVRLTGGPVAHVRKGYGAVVMTNGSSFQIITEIEARVAAAYGWDTLDKPIPR